MSEYYSNWCQEEEYYIWEERGKEIIVIKVLTKKETYAKNLEVAQIHICRESSERMMLFELTRLTKNSEGKERQGWDLRGNIKSSLSLMYHIEFF